MRTRAGEKVGGVLTLYDPITPLVIAQVYAIPYDATTNTKKAQLSLRIYRPSTLLYVCPINLALGWATVFGR